MDSFELHAEQLPSLSGTRTGCLVRPRKPTADEREDGSRDMLSEAGHSSTFSDVVKAHAAAEVHVLPTPACLAVGENQVLTLDVVFPAELQTRAYRFVLELQGKLIWDETYPSGTSAIRCNLQLPRTGVAHGFFLTDGSSTGRSSIFSAFALPVLPAEAAQEMITQCARASCELLDTSHSLHSSLNASCKDSNSPILPADVSLPGIQTNSATQTSCSITTSPALKLRPSSSEGEREITSTSSLDNMHNTDQRQSTSRSSSLDGEGGITFMSRLVEREIGIASTSGLDTMHATDQRQSASESHTTPPSHQQLRVINQAESVERDMAVVRCAEVWRQSIAGIAADMDVVLAFHVRYAPVDPSSCRVWLQQYWSTAETLLSFMLSQGMTHTCAELLAAMEEIGALAMCASLFSVDGSAERAALDSGSSALLSGSDKVVPGAEVVPGAAESSTTEREGPRHAEAVTSAGVSRTPSRKAASLHEGSADHQHQLGVGNHPQARNHTQAGGNPASATRQLRSAFSHLMFGPMDLTVLHGHTIQLMCSVLLLVASIMAGMLAQFNHSYHPFMLALPLLSAVCISASARVKVCIRGVKAALWVAVACAGLVSAEVVEPYMQWLMPLLVHKGWLLLEVVWVSLSEVHERTELALSLCEATSCAALLWLQCGLVGYRDLVSLLLSCICCYVIPRLWLQPFSRGLTRAGEQVAGMMIPEGFEKVECTILTVADRIMSESPRRSLPDSPQMLSTATMVRCQLLVKNAVLLDTPAVHHKPADCAPQRYDGFQQMEATLLLGLLSQTPPVKDGLEPTDGMVLPECAPSASQCAQPPFSAPLDSGSDNDQGTPTQHIDEDTPTTNRNGNRPATSTDADTPADHSQRDASADYIKGDAFADHIQGDASATRIEDSSPATMGSYTWHLCRILVDAMYSLSSSHAADPVAGDTAQSASAGADKPVAESGKPLLQTEMPSAESETPLLQTETPSAESETPLVRSGKTVSKTEASGSSGLSGSAGGPEGMDFSTVQLQEVRCCLLVKDVVHLSRRDGTRASPNSYNFQPINCGLLLKV